MQRARIIGVAALLALSACSSSGLSKEEFIERADAVCAEADAKTKELEVPRTPGALSEFVEQAQEITGKLLNDLRELEPPEEDQDVIDSMLAKIEEAMSYLPEIQQAAEAGELQEISSIARSLQAAAAEANEIAENYGLETCGRSQPAAVP